MLAIAGNERVMADDEIIVSKTNLKGHLTYANDVFLSIANFTLGEVVGKPHSIVRNASMARAIFRLLWARLAARREIFAYVVNRTKHGDHYWVLAHVTSSLNAAGEVIGYHSNRRKPRPAAVAKIKSLYAALLAEEAKAGNRKDGLAASFAYLETLLKEKGMDYDEFVLSL